MSETNFNLAKVSKTIEESSDGIPPLERWDPAFCGDIDMRITRDGRWFYMGTPIGRPAMVKLFSQVLWMEEGRYFLKTPVEKVGIKVDDAPFLFVAVEKKEGDKGPELVFTSLTDDKVTLGKAHQLWIEHSLETGEPSPYIHVRFGIKGLIHRNVFYELVNMAEEVEKGGETTFIVTSQGVEFVLDTVC
ncbi:DUF1285 domain-containing protein [Neptuniibacter marinus]|uniref:DUF1285 domain-containing protein n=1 Tax=Neptuniibacter marinus TaxID=1806670 RepID=UPI00082A2D5E|nr:DUF1285 domain-containing protein [Neptuniibacter marinus]